MRATRANTNPEKLHAAPVLFGPSAPGLMMPSGKRWRPAAASAPRSTATLDTGATGQGFTGTSGN
eukprot:8909296-Pyramimonas_sp.AAC.1